MEIHVKESTIIRPALETPKQFLPVSDLDLLVPAVHVPSVYFYRRPNDSSNFFDAGLLKEALSKVLVLFYPVAGRLRRDENGRPEIDCNGEGVLFLEAETSCVIEDFEDFSQGLKLLSLFPKIDGTKDISSNPLMVTQVNRFKCGGVCVGVGLHHILVDAVSAYDLINAWAEVTHGIPISTQPFFDRTLLGIGIPPSPKFHHIEYDPSPSMNTPTQNTEGQPNPGSIGTAILQLSLDQINTLKEKSKNDHGSTARYTRFEIIAAHIWRCACKARGLADDQASKLYFPTNGRSRLNPPLPSGYFGNAVFTSATIALSGDIQSEPLSYAVERIHNAVNRMDDEYLKSALAYVKQRPDPTILRRGSHTFKCPNFNVSSLMRMPVYGANFGWGPPIFTSPLYTFSDGISHILPGPTNDGSFSVIISLQAEHMQLFKKLFYDI